MADQGNVLMDKTVAATAETALDGARQIVRMARRMQEQQIQWMARIRQVVVQHGVSALTAELGDDESAEMARYYNQVRSAVNAATTNEDQPPITG